MLCPRTLVPALLLIATPLLAQTPAATLAGDVHDPSGAAIGSARVSVRNTGTNVQRVVITNESGRYQVAPLAPGEYEVSIEAAGFHKEVRSGVILQVAQEARLDIQLQVGQMNEVVSVSADAALVQTESSSAGSVIDNRKVVELPLNSREFYTLAQLAPGAYPPAQNSTLGFRGGFNVAGAKETDNNFTVNGIDNNDEGTNAPSFRPSVDAIQEFKLLTGTYSAEYGRSSGAQVVVITKSGTNALHGGLFEFVRNQMFDARNFFTAPGPDPSYKRNQFGGTFGGPIRKDKTFFFFSYEGLRLRQQLSTLATVPLTEMKDGDFRALLALPMPKQVVDPLTGLDFTMPNVIPASRINATGLSIANYYPSPTAPTAVGSLPANNYNFSETRQETMNEYSLKIDHTFSAKDSIYGNYNHFDDPSFEPTNSLCGSSVLPKFGCNVGNTTQLAAFSETHIFSPAVVNEIRLGFNRLRQPRIQEDNAYPLPPLAGVFFDNSAPNNRGVPNTTMAGYSTLGGATNLPQDRADNTFQVIETLSMTRGKHSVKFGADIRAFQGNNVYTNSGRGTLAFNGTTTAPTSGYTLADLLLGYPSSSGRNPLAPKFYSRLKAYDFYAQDDWKILPSLTLNIGLRYELNTPMTNLHDALANFDAGTGQIIVAGQNGQPSNVYDWDKNNFAPRLGFAWQPFRNGKTVGRGGYGVFYNAPTTFNGILNLSTGLPFRNPQTFNSSKASPVTLDNPFPAANAGGASTATGFAKDFANAYSTQWNLNIQHELGGDMILEVGYYGAKGTRLPVSRNLNQPAPGPGTTAQVNARRPYPQWGNISWIESGGNSSYNSLQAKLEKRFSHGISFLLGYTFGKSIDDSPGIASTSSSSRLSAQDAYNRAAERGLSDFDVRHRVVFSPVWNLPFGAGHKWAANGWPAWIAGGWEASGILTFQTGRPITPYLSANQSNTFNNSDRPNVVGDPNAGPSTVTQWFDTAAFQIPALGTFGNAGRNIIEGPGLAEIDLSFARNFKIRENLRIQFRGELFNAINHANFNLPAITADVASFGQIPSALDPRQVQFGLKLSF